jgi:hypothetical protein
MKHLHVEPGLYKGKRLYALLEVVEDDKLYLEKQGEVDIAIGKDDLVLVTDEDQFVSGKSNVPENHKLINPILFSVNGNEEYRLSCAKVTGEQIKDIAKLSDVTLYIALDGMPDYLLGDSDQLVVSKSFDFLAVETVCDAGDAPDLEQCCCAPNGPGRKDKYRIRIDKEKYTVDKPRLTGKEILALAGYTNAEERVLYQKFSGGRTELISPNEKVDLSKPGIERFMTIPCEQQEGLQSSRRQFVLPENDSKYLDAIGLDWETVIEGNIKRLFIYSFPVPEGYNVSKVDVSLDISPSYPTTQIDMAYFYPHLERADQKVINCITLQTFDGKAWQRWSRHRTSANPWRPGIDCIETHVAYMLSWFSKELAKR